MRSAVAALTAGGMHRSIAVRNIHTTTLQHHRFSLSRPRPSMPWTRVGGIRSLSSFRDPYATLGVPRGASDDEIKKAYRKLALKHHPTTQRHQRGKETTALLPRPKQGLPTGRFRAITEAYQALTSKGQSSGSGPFQGGGFGGHPGGGGFRQDDFDQAERVFREFFGGKSIDEILREAQQQQGFGRHPGGFPGGGFPGGAQEVRQEIHRRPDGTMVMRTTTITRRPDGTTQQQVEEREIGANMNMGPFPGMRMEQRQMSEEEMKAMQEEMRKVAKQAVKEVGKAAVSAAASAATNAVKRRVNGLLDGITSALGGGKNKK